MRRFSLLAPLLVAVLLSVGVAGRVSAITRAQEGTPSATDMAPEGITFTPLGFGTADTLPATPADFSLFRIGFDPGASFPIEATDPSVALVFVEAGAITIRVDAPTRVTRAATIAAFATPGMDENAIPAPDEIAAGIEFTMAAGDSAFFPPNETGEVRNDGQEQAVILIANIEPQGSGGSMTGTPAP
jgi:quercetin dioxygenase-like cupin family protein